MKYIISAIILFLVLSGGYYFFPIQKVATPEVFPPQVSATSTPVITQGTGVKLHQTFSVRGISIEPLEVLEDSRCPSDVQCVWAGQLRLSARLTITGVSQTVIYTLGVPLKIESSKITLSRVDPKLVSTRPVISSDYVFYFDIE